MGLFFLLILPLVFLTLVINFFIENIPIFISSMVLIMISAVFGILNFFKTFQNLNKNLEKFFDQKMPCNFKERAGKSLTSARLGEASWAILTGLILFGGLLFLYGFFALSQTPFEELPLKQQFQVPVIMLLGGLLFGFAMFEAAKRK